MKMKRRCAVVMAVFISLAHTAFAGVTPVQLALWRPIQIFPETSDVYGLRLNLLFGKNRDMYGIDLGAIDMATRDCAGVQIGLLATACVPTVSPKQASERNAALRAGTAVPCTMDGVQVATLGNMAETVRGIQAAGLFNIASPMDGIQLAGLVNYVGPWEDGQLKVPVSMELLDNADRVALAGRGAKPGIPGTRELNEIVGLQAAGFANFAAYCRGVQVAAPSGFNFAGEMDGIQISAGIIGGNTAVKMKGIEISAHVVSRNVADEMQGLQVGALFLMNRAGKMAGVQVSPISNSAERMTGVQLGLVNYCKQMTGIQIGICNIIRDSPVPFMPLVNASF